MNRSVSQIQADISEKEAYLADQLKDLRAELRAAESAVRLDRRLSYQQRKQQLNESAVIFEKILKPGDFIKVTGSRTSGYRRVISILPSKLNFLLQSQPGEVIGASCHYKHSTASIGKVDETNIITCMTNKITAVLRDGAWVTAADILTELS